MQVKLSVVGNLGALEGDSPHAPHPWNQKHFPKMSFINVACWEVWRFEDKAEQVSKLNKIQQ